MTKISVVILEISKIEHKNKEVKLSMERKKIKTKFKKGIQWSFVTN